MPSLRIARLCHLRQREVQQPLTLHHARPSPSNRPLKHRQGMLSSPSSSMFKLDGCIPKQDLSFLYHSSCRCPLIKRRVCNVKPPQGFKSPSTPARFSRHHARVDRKAAFVDGLLCENVDSYHQQLLQRSKGRLSQSTQFKGKAKLPSRATLSHDCVCVDGEKSPHDDEEMCAYQCLQSGLDNEADNHRFGEEVLDPGIFANQQFDKATNSEFKEMHVKAFKKGCTSSGPTMWRQNALTSFDSDQEEPLSTHGLMISEQRASFPYDGIFYQKPKARINAPRRATKLDPACSSPPNSSKHRHHAAPRFSKKSKNATRKADFHDSCDFRTRRLLSSHDGLELPMSGIPPFKSRSVPSQVVEGQSSDKLEHFAVHESAETTRDIIKCLRLAENKNDEAAHSLSSVYQQGEQIRHTHEHTLDIDHNLSAGEKVLGSFGGLFAKTWKPVKTRAITGPETVDQKRTVLKTNLLRDKGVSGRGKSRPQIDLMSHLQLPWQAKVEIEERVQDEALTDLGNVVSRLKKMSADLGKQKHWTLFKMK